ncbi:MAG TPA: hypothetical protein VF040_04425, partial [Ktedonobacterales bacterium]
WPAVGWLSEIDVETMLPVLRRKHPSALLDVLPVNFFLLDVALSARRDCLGCPPSWRSTKPAGEILPVLLLRKIACEPGIDSK